MNLTWKSAADSWNDIAYSLTKCASNRLQSGAVGVEGEIAIAQRYLAVEAGPVNIVPGHQRMPINGEFISWRQRGGAGPVGRQRHGQDGSDK